MGEFLHVESRRSITEDIMKALQDSTKLSIGIYGFGGMGKTTLAKQIASLAAKHKMFQKVAMASVTQTVDVKQIQGQIASMLGLKLEDSTVAERADRINKRLKGKKVLVILDDLWRALDLKEVGIPFGANHIGCKLLLTSRSRNVLCSMGTEYDFNLGALEEEDSWRLFEEKIGWRFAPTSDFVTIAKQVAKRCHGFPILIAIVAASLSKQPRLPAWNDALNELKSTNHNEIHKIVCSAIERISYNHLERSHQQLFLLCGMMGGDATVQQLLHYGLGLGLFDEWEMTVQEARDRLHTLILDLKESFLLLDNDHGIKVHDVVRDVAVYDIARNLNMMYLNIEEYDDAELNLWRKHDDIRKCTALVLRSCPSLHELPPLLECPSLELFILSGLSKNSSPAVPETFFERTMRLKVLDMSQLSFSALPPSLCFMNTLQTLRVENCYGLKDISVVGELRKLQILSFAGSNIEELPGGIRQLSELRVLNLTGCSQLKVVPEGLIAGLTRLEELCMSKSFDRWEVEECDSGIVTVNASLRELNYLPKLSNMEIKVADANFLPEGFHFEMLQRHEIIVGDMWAEPWFDEPEITRKFCLQLCNSTSTDYLLHFLVRPLLKNTECLCLGELKGIESVIPELDKDGFPNLKHFHIQTDYEIRYIVYKEAIQHGLAFPTLQSLHLSNMLKLEKICNGRLMKKSFGDLRRLIVEKCDSLKYLFTFSIAIGLVKLQELTVKQCAVTTEIVATEEETGIEIILFPQLRYLCLEELTNLTTFYSGAEEISSDMSVQPLFNEKVKIPNLRRLEISGLNSITTIWLNHLFEEDSCFQLKQVIVRDCASLTSIFPSLTSKVVCLKEVTVLRCDGIKHVFPISMAASFHWLEKLTIEDCEVETIFDDLEEIKEEVKFVFSKLDRLYLKRLPNLECFYPSEHTIQCPALKEFCISNCDKISAWNFLHFQGNQFQKVISNLEFLGIRGRDMMKMEREDGHLPPNVFATVQRLVIKDFDDKSASFPSKFLQRFENVTRLALYDCSFQEIFPYEGVDDMVLGKLRELKLSKLPELKSICKLDSPLIQILENLIESLQVWECPRLTNLVPLRVSFRVLTRLEICKCAGLINLIQSPTTTMAKLQVLRVSGCEMLEAIIAGDESKHDTVIFSELRVLELEDLPKLTSFYSRTCIFEFPLLEEVSVGQCPNMKTFCGGTTVAPKLHKLNLNASWTEGPWEGDLNATIQQVFAEMEDRRLTARLPATSSGSPFVELTERGKESRSSEIVNKVEVSEDAINPEDEVEVSEPRKGTDICEEPNHSQEQIIAASIASQRVVDSSSQSSQRIRNNPEINHSLATDATTSIATASSRQKDLSEIIDDNVSPDISAKAISKRRLKLAEIAAKLQTLEETKKALEDELVAIQKVG